MARLRPTSLDGRSGIQPRTVESSRLQIRVVPYSPPRLSSDDSSDSRPMSYPDCSPEQPVFSPLQETANQHERENCDSSSPVVGSHDQGPISHDNPLNLANESTGSVGHVRQTRNWSDANLETILASPSPCYRRAKRTIAINSDKTFSLVQQSCSSTSTTDSPPSSRRLWTNPSSSADRTVSGTCIEDGQSSPLQPVQGRSRPLSPYCSLPASSSPPLPAGLADADASAPCNYTLVGGVRKVPSSVERGGKRKSLSLSSPSAGRNLQVAFVESVSTASSFARPGMPTTEQTFHASESTSTLSERSNYKTFVSESPCYSAGQHLVEADDLSQDHSIPSPELSNIEIIGESCSERSLSNRSGSDTNDSDNNYELHGDFQSSPIITAASISVLKPEYSRESLVVAPLRPGRRILPNRATVSRQRSRDSIRTGSLSSISSAFAEEAARSLFGGSAMISSHGGFRRISSRQNTSIGREHRHLNISQQQQQQQQHRRSTTLSPVLSESDRGSAVPSLAFSHTTTGDHRRRSQTSALDTPCLSPQDGRSDMEAWEEIPYPASYRVWNRDMNSSSLRLIRDQDEHGDGLAELEALQQCPSRTKFHSYLSKFPSDRNLCSSGSSRSNSFSRSYIPTWARLYYGSGERRFPTLQQSSDSLFSEFNANVYHSPLMSRSTSAEGLALVHQASCQRPPPVVCRAPTPSRSASDGGISFPAISLVRRIRKQTSSIWSPHLRRDKRSRGYSLWRPPSAIWVQAERNCPRSNSQTALFFLGFVFPFAWMLASCLPLPPMAPDVMKEKHHETGHPDLEEGGSRPTKGQNNTSCYTRAKWWRTLNRYMSIIGLLFVAAAVALIVTGAQQWRPRR